MSKKLDAHADLVMEAAQLNAEFSKLGKEYRELEKRKKAHTAKVLELLGKSEIGSIDGQDFVKKVVRNTRTVTVADVEALCPPELAQQLIKVNVSQSIKFY